MSIFTLLLAAAAGGAPTAAHGHAGSAGPIALLSNKIVTCANEGPAVIDHGTLLIEDGRIRAVGPRDAVEIPEGFEVLDVGDNWLVPGFIDLHCHVAGPDFFSGNDLNDSVYLTNPGLRASSVVLPGVAAMKNAVGGGVTTTLLIPGSATNIGGQGVLVKSGFDKYAPTLLRDPGSMKLAQSGNPERWGFFPGRSLMNWNTRNTLRRGVTYAKAWEAFEAGEGSQPDFNPQFEIFRALRKGEAQISTHTQIYQVVLMTLTMVARDFGLPVYLDHSTIGGWKAGAIAKELGVPAIVGPRQIDSTSRIFLIITGNRDDRFEGVAAGYQRMGMTEIGFNTDSPVIPQEELPLQAAIAARYGFRDTNLETIRGLTIVPARAAGIDDRVGSLEVGKDADVVVIGGHPIDPRFEIDYVFVNGQRVLDRAVERRRW